MISKDKMSVTVGVAFVWFTTQFGGGFASGNQLRQYFVQFGIWAFVTCIMTQFLGAFFQWYALKYAKSMRYTITEALTTVFTASMRRFFPICMSWYIL